MQRPCICSFPVSVLLH